MFTKDDIRTTTFIPLSAIYREAAKEFGVDAEDIANEIANMGPWSWGDSSIVLIDDFELYEPLAESLMELGVDEDDIQTWMDTKLSPAIGVIMIDISK